MPRTVATEALVERAETRVARALTGRGRKAEGMANGFMTARSLR
jgi:hypothetical protein